MKLGKAYKLAAAAAAHRVKAHILLAKGDVEGERKENLEYLKRLDDIPPWHRQKVMNFFNDAVQLKLDFIKNYADQNLEEG
jgi:hypothetical protein